MHDSYRKATDLWGKVSKKTSTNKLEFLNRSREKFDWDNDDLDVSALKVVPEVVNPHPEIPAEFPGVRLESDYDGIHPAVESDPVLTEAQRAAAALRNAGLAETPGVSPRAHKTTGVIDLSEDDTDDTPELVQGYDSDSESESEDEDEDDHENVKEEVIDPSEQEGAEANLPEMLGRGMRIRKKTENYVPSMQGKKYELGVLNLCYRGNRYKLKDGVVSFNVDSHVSGDEATSYEAVTRGEFDTTVEVLGVIMVNQFNLKRGLELFGDKAEIATVSELKQIHDMGTYVPLEASELTKEQKAKALSALMFIVEKRDGKVKARKCAVGSKQRTFEGYNKAEWASPTVSTDGVLLTSAIEAHEGRHTATCDLPGAFLNTDNNEETIMLLKGRLAELMVQVDPKMYRKYLTTNKKNEPMLYVKLSKALYGLLQSALLFYNKLRGELEDYGFEINPYDPCVANKMVNGSQMTVTWHVDDLKVSHKDKFVVTKFLKYLGDLYGNRITVNRGKVHDCLGMDLDATVPQVC